MPESNPAAGNKGLAHKNVLVTGGANGIGRVLVDRLIAAGAAVGVFDLDQQALDRVATDHPAVHCDVCDVGDPDEVSRAVNAFAEKVGLIHVLVNNAGFIYSAPLLSFGKSGFVTHSVEMWDKVIRTDLSAVFYVTAQVAQRMVQKRIKGVVVNISSIAAVGNVGQSAYSAAKAGVNALTVAWAKELSPLGIRFVGIAPGFTNTPRTVESVAEKALAGWVKETPMRRLGTPKEIADAILFAITNEFVNGKILEVDGGLRL